MTYLIGDRQNGSAQVPVPGWNTDENDNRPILVAFKPVPEYRTVLVTVYLDCNRKQSARAKLQGNLATALPKNMSVVYT